MSRVRGAFPLFLATGVGVANGIWIFGPLLKEQKETREGQEREELKTLHHSDNAQVETIRTVEASTHPVETINTAFNPVESSGSWWSNILWNRNGNIQRNQEPNNVSPTEPNDRSVKP